tara:strand:+ start:350 stop:529 length:180 start_codon:yes stop_codon:yes gene_type:complete
MLHNAVDVLLISFIKLSLLIRYNVKTKNAVKQPTQKKINLKKPLSKVFNVRVILQHYSI